MEGRKKYGIKAGTKIELIDAGERIVLQPTPHSLSRRE
jgi:bifunctional DNA-binding transcriptional regulator/antitoxin component of YhaV-PrlF toxin-antitoxin module